MKSNYERPAARRARILSLTALAPLMLAACSGPAAEHSRDVPSSVPAGKHTGTVEKTYPKKADTVGKPAPVQATVPSPADPVTVPAGDATEPAPAAEPAAFTADRSFHVVRAGDTLESISDDNGWGSWPEVAESNNIPAPYILFEGQKITGPKSAAPAAAASIQPAGLTLTPAPAVEAATPAPQAEEAATVEAPATEPAAEPVREAELPAAPAPVAVPEAAPVEGPEHRADDEVSVPVQEVTPAPTPTATAPVAPEAPVEESVEVPAPVEVTAPQAPAIPEPVAAAPAAPVAGSTAFAARSLELINEYRAANGAHALSYDSALETMAVNWAGAQKTAIDTYGWDGVAHNPNLAAELPAGWSNYAENIAVNYTPETMIEWWKNSPSHNAAMLSPALDAFGFGSAELDPNSWLAGNHVGVQVFARY